MKKELKFPLNIQLFAEDPAPDPAVPLADPKTEEKMFTQAEVDKIIADRLKREGKSIVPQRKKLLRRGKQPKKFLLQG